jgi:transcriptional regulator with XRE-family HTH domain
MTDTLNPDTLKVLRDLRGWSQDRLAKESKISKSQISRWERGQQTAKIHQNTRERLCQALGVKWDKLTRAVEKPNPNVFRAPLKAGISFPAKTALTVIRYHYGLREEAILDLAPLAFLILAERSLRARRQALDEAEKALNEATETALRRLPYLPGAIFYGYDDEWFADERKSIEDRDVFAINTNNEGDEVSPFVDFLEKELANLGRFQEYPLEFWPHYRSAPDYEIPAGVFGQMIGLDPQKEDDLAVLECIQRGEIDLEEVVKKKSEATGEEYRRWLTERHQTVLAEEKERNALLFGSLRLDLPGVKEKTTGQDNPTTPSDNHQPTEDPA